MKYLYFPTNPPKGKHLLGFNYFITVHSFGMVIYFDTKKFIHNSPIQL